MTKQAKARRFAEMVIAMYDHEGYFEFDLLGHEYDPVKLALELAGYSVHRNRSRTHLVAAFRVEPDLAPIRASTSSQKSLMA